jgi:hypothetical protein
VTSFLYIIAEPTIKMVTEKSLFGKLYVRIGKLFNVVGYWVYQEGGLLGYSLRDYPSLLGKLAVVNKAADFSESEVAEVVTSIKSLSEEVSRELEEMRDEEKTFFHIFTIRELRKIGIELIRWPPDKSLDKKCNTEFADLVMRTSYIKGIALGFNFPEQFALYWDNTYRARPDSELKELHNRFPDLILPEKVEKLTLKQAIVEMAENAISWGTYDIPNVLDSDDIMVLRSLVSTNKEE